MSEKSSSRTRPCGSAAQSSSSTSDGRRARAPFACPGHDVAPGLATSPSAIGPTKYEVDHRKQAMEQVIDLVALLHDDLRPLAVPDPKRVANLGQFGSFLFEQLAQVRLRCRAIEKETHGLLLVTRHVNCLDPLPGIPEFLQGI